MSETKASSRILVVDDRKSNVRLLKSMLAPQGYEVIEAYNGEEAMDRVTESPPDVIVLDVLMPNMDGFEVTQALRARAETRGTPILMLTALHELSDVVKGLEVGADDFLSKPFRSIELLARVRSLLRIKQLHDELQTRNALLERVLMRYVSEEIAQEILDDPDQNLRLGGQSCQVSVLFADINGFSRFSEEYEVLLVIQVLNRIFNQLVPAIFEHHGTLDKYLGDAIMAFYGAPIPAADSSERAVRTAWSMRERFGELRQKNPVMSKLGLGIGISCGEAVVGNVGSERVMDYTVIGNTPNTAKRLQEYASPNQILISDYVFQNVQDFVEVRAIEPLSFKGFSKPVQAYEVMGIAEPAAELVS